MSKTEQQPILFPTLIREYDERVKKLDLYLAKLAKPPTSKPVEIALNRLPRSPRDLIYLANPSIDKNQKIGCEIATLVSGFSEKPPNFIAFTLSWEAEPNQISWLSIERGFGQQAHPASSEWVQDEIIKGNNQSLIRSDELAVPKRLIATYLTADKYEFFRLSVLEELAKLFKPTPS